MVCTSRFRCGVWVAMAYTLWNRVDTIAIPGSFRYMQTRAPRSQPEDFAPSDERIHEHVDVAGIVVHADARPRGRAHPEAAHQRLRAVVAGADANARAARQLGYVVGVHALDREGRKAPTALSLGRSHQAQSRDLSQALEHVGGEGLLVRTHALHPKRR